MNARLARWAIRKVALGASRLVVECDGIEIDEVEIERSSGDGARRAMLAAVDGAEEHAEDEGERAEYVISAMAEEVVLGDIKIRCGPAEELNVQKKSDANYVKLQQMLLESRRDEIGMLRGIVGELLADRQRMFASQVENVRIREKLLDRQQERQLAVSVVGREEERKDEALALVTSTLGPMVRGMLGGGPVAPDATSLARDIDKVLGSLDESQFELLASHLDASQKAALARLFAAGEAAANAGKGAGAEDQAEERQ